jgi:hypothetical protein
MAPIYAKIIIGEFLVLKYTFFGQNSGQNGGFYDAIKSLRYAGRLLRSEPLA